MTHDRSPDPPPDYRTHTPDSDPSIGPVVWVLAVGWLLAVVVLGALVALNYEHYTALGVVGVVLVTTVVHEAVHAVVGWMLGLELTAGIDFGGLTSGPYILPHGGFQTRRESALLAAAPTLVLTPVLLLFAVVGGTTTALAALAALFVNTLGALADLRVAVTALRLPSGALTYPTGEGEMEYYVPVKSASPGR